jgi:dTDP-4-dehydrorhamnose 3,5-epimerase
MIDGVRVTPLKQIQDDRGKVMHMLRNDSEVFQGFGEIYFSSVYPGAVKAWRLHRKMIVNYAVPAGNLKLVLFDGRESSPTKGECQEIFLGPDNYCLVTIPTMIWSGFQAIGPQTAILANCATIPHDPRESERLDPFDPSIPYDWNAGKK